MTDATGGAGPAANRPGALDTVPNRSDIRRAARIRYKAARELDQLLSVERTDTASPDWDQFALGWNERRAAA